MKSPSVVDDDHFDARADDEIAACVTADPPVSFFLFAGAGSGKTTSLVEALRRIRRDGKGARFRLNGRQVGVITFMNKARDEIKNRLEYDDLFAVSTVHSFAWSLIGGLNHDIREWLRGNLQMEIEELEQLESRGRAGRASMDRKNKIATKGERLHSLDNIRHFIYNPDGDNREACYDPGKGDAGQPGVPNHQCG